MWGVRVEMEVNVVVEVCGVGLQGDEAALNFPRVPDMRGL